MILGHVGLVGQQIHFVEDDHVGEFDLVQQQLRDGLLLTGLFLTRRSGRKYLQR